MLLSAIERAPGNRTDKTSYEPVTKYQQALTENNLNHMAANRFQQLASMTEEHFEAAVATAKDTVRAVAGSARPGRLPQNLTMSAITMSGKGGGAKVDGVSGLLLRVLR